MAAEMIVSSREREIAILAATESVSVTRGRFAPGERVAGPHIHREHTDAFYVLEGELTIELGSEAETVRVGAGGFVAIPPGVVHAVRNDGDRVGVGLSIHAPDGGFAAFMRGIRDGVEVEWDIAAPPPGGGLPGADAVVRTARPR